MNVPLEMLLLDYAKEPDPAIKGEQFELWFKMGVRAKSGELVQLNFSECDETKDMIVFLDNVKALLSSFGESIKNAMATNPGENSSCNLVSHSNEDGGVIVKITMSESDKNEFDKLVLSGDTELESLNCWLQVIRVLK